MFKNFLKKTVEGAVLTENEARMVMDLIMNGEASSSQIASLLSILRFRGETIEEMTGFVRSMKDHVVRVEHDMEVMDTCGTGGDGASTFNISTAAAIVLSAAGVKVAKHGNRAASSKSGSADVLEHLGVSIQQTADESVEALRRKNMCFLFAQAYHVSMKHVAKTRKEVGFRTIFNLLGPLTNPANCQRQLIGVFDTVFAEKMAKTLRNLGTEKALIVTGRDGIDECSISSQTDVVKLEGGSITRDVLTPEEVGLNRGSLDDIRVDSAEQSAALITKVLSGEANESATNIVLLNAGAGLYAAGAAETIAEGVDVAAHTISSGRAYEQLQLLRKRKVESHA